MWRRCAGLPADRVPPATGCRRSASVGRRLPPRQPWDEVGSSRYREQGCAMPAGGLREASVPGRRENRAARAARLPTRANRSRAVRAGEMSPLRTGQPSRLTHGTTSRAPKRGWAPRCPRRSRVATTALATDRAASSTACRGSSQGEDRAVVGDVRVGVEQELAPSPLDRQRAAPASRPSLMLMTHSSNCAAASSHPGGGQTRKKEKHWRDATPTGRTRRATRQGVAWQHDRKHLWARSRDRGAGHHRGSTVRAASCRRSPATSVWPAANSARPSKKRRRTPSGNGPPRLPPQPHQPPWFHRPRPSVPPRPRRRLWLRPLRRPRPKSPR